MALLIGRFMHYFPAYKLSDVFPMPASQFFLLNRKIRRLVAEEEARALSVTHHGEPGKRMRELLHEMDDGAPRRHGPSSEIIIAEDQQLGVGIVRRANAGEITALRERQRAAQAEIAKDPKGWVERIKTELELANKPPSLPDE